MVVITGLDVIFPREGIGGSHINSLFYSPSNVIFLEEQPPPGLSVAKILGLFEIPQVLMICYYGYRVFHASEVMAPLFQGLDNSKQFSVVDVVVSFGGRKGGGMISTRVKVSVRVLLHEYSSGSSEGGISHDKERLGSIQHFDHWCRQECFLELDECLVLLFSPVEGYPLLG